MGAAALIDGAADLRGVWECYEGPMKGHVERIEQAGNRITITTGGLVHDMFCDGTLENGVNDTAGIGGRRIRSRLGGRTACTSSGRGTPSWQSPAASTPKTAA